MLPVAIEAQDYSKYYQNLPVEVKQVSRPMIPSNEINIKDVGGVGDGLTLNTEAFTKGISKLNKLGGGKLVIPEGVWLTGPISMKDNIELHLDKNALIIFSPDKKLYVNPEAKPGDRVYACIRASKRKNIAITGEGIIDGRANEGDWWIRPKEIRIASRGNLFYTQRCKGMLVQGLTFMNSPSWNIHPAFSEDLDFIDIRVKAPWDSPNTDGFDPESCRNVRLLGAEISVGDDCIAIKSGKIGLGRKYKRPCENLEIGWCALLDGHGGVTVGSEMAGGVRKVRAHHCYMKGNDRALRIKTRRDRGKDGIVDDILFQDIRMDGVKMPLIVNSFYFCDADGKSERVQSREKLPADETTPEIGTVCFERVDATGCKACVAYAMGLPEKPMKQLTLRNCRFDFDPEAKPLVPAMALGVEECCRRGIIAKYIRGLTLENIQTTGVEGELLDTLEVEKLDIHDQK